MNKQSFLLAYNVKRATKKGYKPVQVEESVEAPATNKPNIASIVSKARKQQIQK